MPSGAKLSVFALAAVGALGWVVLGVTPTVRRPRAAGAERAGDAAGEDAHAHEDADEHEYEDEHEDDKVGPGPAAAAVANTPTPASEPTAVDPQAEPPATEEADPIADAYADRERRIELNVRLYDEARARFASEVRDQTWATQRERTLRTMADEGGAGDLIDNLECRSSLCELRMRFNGLTPAGMAVRLSPLSNAMGPDRVLRNEGPPDQRVMVIYLPREGSSVSPAEGALDGK